MLANYVSPFDATVVEKFRAAGMVTLGKLNCDEFAMGSANENSAFGAVKNPWDKTAVPGGSSGSAAVAARLAPAATGTDTGGSIRQPAAFCGITGIKPTYGRVSRFGMIAFASSLDQGGPMAQTAEDCALLLNAMAGFDERDSTSLAPELGGVDEDFTRELGQPLTACASACRKNTSAKAWPPTWKQAVRAALASMKTRRHAGRHLAAEYRAVDSGLLHDRAGRSLVQPVALRRRALRPPRGRLQGPAGHVPQDPRRRLRLKSSAASWSAPMCCARLLRRLLPEGAEDPPPDRAGFRAVLNGPDAVCDVIMGPVAPTVAWDLGDKSDDPVAAYLADIYTLSTSLAGLPGMSIPCGFGRAKNASRPVGLQIIGKHFGEAKLLNVAHQYQLATDWHKRAPASDPADTAHTLQRHTIQREEYGMGSRHRS
jgi:aspartyl-tRNA(Asn)/glutamyl-tRNA(Gln) amidotransferase subunit A